MQTVTKAAAYAAPTLHQFIEGIGFIKHPLPPEFQQQSRIIKNCNPPAGVAAWSMHELTPPNGHPPVTMKWDQRYKCWHSLQPSRGHRIAFSADHLARAGWSYKGPSPFTVILAPDTIHPAPARTKRR